MSDYISDDDVFLKTLKYIVTLLIVLGGITGIVIIADTKSQERIKLAKIAAATSQYCDCLKMIEVE